MRTGNEKEKGSDEKLKAKFSHMTMTALLILIVSLPITAFTVPRVSALSESAHQYICSEALDLFPSSPMQTELNSHLESIRNGAYDEDHTDHIYADITHDWKWINQIPHFWDADSGPDDWVKNIFGQDDRYPNAYMKARELFSSALNFWNEGNEADAYERLGHAAHLIGDMIPSHVHEDFHPDIADIGGGGDDCYEDWMADGGYDNWGAGSALAQGGMVKFPDDIETEMRANHNWAAGIYYLMYTANQRADYFASDDVSGDTNDPEGWMDYSGWPSSPTDSSDLGDNDWSWYGPIPWDDDNNNDGDLARIASYSFVYSIRAVAALFKMFYELTHEPTGTIAVRFADNDGNGKADYKWVSLDLTYDSGTGDYAGDLECSFRNEVDYLWTNWQPVAPRKSWILSEGDGTRTVYYQLRNLMGELSPEYSVSVELLQCAIPQVFNYEFSATGCQYPISAQLDFYVTKIWAGDVNFYFDALIDDGQGNTLLGGESQQEPYDSLAYDCHFDVELDLTNLYEDDVVLRSGGWIIPIQPFDWSLLRSITVVAGQTVRLRTHGYNHIPLWFDDDLSDVYTPTYSVPYETGTHTLASGWFETKSDGTINPYYSLYVVIVATVTSTSWEGYEVPYSNEAAVGYGEPERYIASASLDLTAPADLYWPYPQTTQWQAHLVPPNPAIDYRMDGRDLYAWTRYSEPDMIIAGLSPVDLMITDPDGNRVGIQKLADSLVITNEIPGANILQIDLDGDGDLDTLIVFDDRKVGNYDVQISPSVEANPDDTVSVAISLKRRNRAPIIIGPSGQIEETAWRSGFLVQDAPIAQVPVVPLLLQSTDAGANLPPKASAGGPYWATEGAAIDFDASSSSDPEGDSLTYRWDFDNDGTWDTAWSANPTASHLWQDDWTGTAKVEVGDGTHTVVSTATVTVFNTAPTVNAGLDQFASPGDEVQFSGSFTDDGIMDTHTIYWEFGDGATAEGTLNPTHVYSAAKIYTVNLLVTDDDGDVGKGALIVNTGVEVTITPLQAIVPPGDDTSYHVIIHNLRNTQESYNLELYGLDPTWYSLQTHSVTLDPDQSIQITLPVFPPITALSKAYRFTVVASSQADPRIADTADADVLAATSHDLDLEEIPPSTTLAIGQPKYVDPISNEIFVTSITPFTLTAEDNPDGTGVAVSFYHILNATHDTGRLEYTSPFCLTGLSDGEYSIVYYSKDNVANKEPARTEQVTLDNSPPTITVVLAPVSINTPVTLLARVDDSTTGGCIIASAEFSVDGGVWIPMEPLDGSFDEVKEDAAAGLAPVPMPNVFAISIRGADALGNQYELLTLLAVYDPAAGFVTGGGWIDSPLGAYPANPALTGKATFGFVSKYLKGATVPTGNTEFQFHVAGLNFHSDSYQWLVISGSKAQFKGWGTINGAGNYGFILTAIDGQYRWRDRMQIRGGFGVDKFRIKIWDTATGTIIYDNQMDVSDTMNPTTTLAGGNIIIQTG